MPGFLFKYIKYMDQSVDMLTKIEEIDQRVHTDYDGDKTLKYIEILRIAGSMLDKDGKSLIKFESELPPKSPSPFIFAVEIPNAR